MQSARVPRIEEYAPEHHSEPLCDCGEPTAWIGIVRLKRDTPAEIPLCWWCVFDFSELEDVEIPELATPYRSKRRYQAVIRHASR